MTIRDTATTPEAVETPDPPASLPQRRGRRWPVSRIAVGLVALGFFLAPTLAGLAGERSGAIENRPLAPFPSLADGWDFFPNLDKWAVDHLPLRDRTIQANDEVSDRLFKELPASAGGRPLTMMGTDGRLFLSDDFAFACTAKDQTATVGANVERLARLIQRASGSVTTFVAPDKTSIETDFLPNRFPLDKCGGQAKRALREKLASTPPPGYVDLFGPIADVNREHGSAYLRNDTHWNDYGRIQFARVCVTHLNPTLWNGVRIEEGTPRQVVGDLHVLRGRATTTTSVVSASVVRPGVTTTFTNKPMGNTTTEVSVSTSTGAALHPGRTVFIGDSFMNSARASLRPFFSELVFVSPSMGTVGAEDLARLLLSANTVVFEQVERLYLGSQSPLLATAFLDAMEQVINKARPVR